MDKILDLINRITKLIEERELELKHNNENKNILSKEHSDLLDKDTELILELEAKKHLKREINKNIKKINLEKIGAIFLSAFSMSLLVFISAMVSNVVLQYSVLKTVIITLLTLLVTSPFIISNEFKEYKNTKRFLFENPLENVLEDIEENKEKQQLNKNKISLTHKKIKDINDRNIEVETELKELYSDLYILKEIKNQSENNKDLIAILMDTYSKYENYFNIEKNIQKIKK